MATRGLYYIKPYVVEFDKKFRLYLNDEANSRSFISSNLIDSINPIVIEHDFDGEFVALDLINKTIEGVNCKLTVNFDVENNGGNDFVLGNDVLRNYNYDNEGILLEEGEVIVYFR